MRTQREIGSEAGRSFSCESNILNEASQSIREHKRTFKISKFIVLIKIN